MEYKEQLKEYGILATNAQVSIQDDVLSITSAQIDEMNLECEKLKKEKIKKIHIFGSEIQYIYFTKDTTIDIDFKCCNFKNQVIAREYNFNNTIAFIECIFESIVDFSKTTFQCEVDFFASTFKDETNFTEARFLVKQRDNNKIAKNNFIKSTFEKDVSFDDVEFHTKVYFVISHFKAQASFIRTKFLAKQDDNGIIENGFAQIIFKGNAYFNDAKFQAKVSFAMSHFEAQANFTETKFLAKQDNGRIIENNFSEVIFEKSAYFNDSVFENFADFNKCDFREIANFYGVTFKKTPNFSQTIFNGSVNLVNANLKFNFKDLQTTINQKYDFYKKSIKITADAIITKSQNKSLDKFANDFRDSFRVFKNALIKDNNLLDASEFHKCELYCKELELKESRHKRGINTNNNEDARKNIKPFKELIDFLLLRFYRNLCDHHTDFLKCFNNLVLLVALYAVLLWIGNFDLMQGKEPIISDILHQLGDKAITLKKDIKKYDWLVFLIFLALAVSCLYYLYKTIYLEHKLYIKNIKLILSFTKNSLKNICFFILISVAIIFFYAAIIATLITLLNLNDMHYWQSYLNFISFVLFFVIYFSLISLDCVFVRFLLVIAAYIITSISIGKNIAILNPLIGKLLNTSIEIKDPIFQSITIAYTISTLLVLFSLQKTARKNSIVPN